jgi:hypothetical protein
MGLTHVANLFGIVKISTIFSGAKTFWLSRSLLNTGLLFCVIPGALFVLTAGTEHARKLTWLNMGQAI